MSAAMSISQKPALELPGLEKLPPKRQAFLLPLIGEAMGNATAAARIAGYKAPHVEGARLLGIASVKGVLEAYRSSQTSSKIATAAELQELWTAIARGEDASFDSKDRLKATEYLAKSRQMFVDRQQVDVRTVNMHVQFRDVAECATWAAGEESNDSQTDE